MNHIIETITQYKTKSVGPITSQQIAYIPRIENDQIDYTIPYYILEGKRVLVNISNQLFIKLKYLKFRSPLKYYKYRSNIWSMEELINNKVIIPFMLFIDGYFVPWEYMNIVIDNNNIHIVVNGNNIHYKNLCKNYHFIQIITLPEYMICVKNYTGDPYSTMFSFDENGKFDLDNPVYSFISSTSGYAISFNYWHTNTDVNAFKMISQNDIGLSESNVILFVNGTLATGVREKVKRAIDGEYIGKDNKVYSCLDFTYNSDVIRPNPTIEVNSSLLTIDGGKNYFSHTYDFAVFVNPLYTESIDNTGKVQLDELAKTIRKKNISGSNPEYLNDLLTPFEMKMNFNSNYSDNIAEAIKTVMQYNTSLFNPVFQKKSNLVIEEHNGEWIYANIHDDGTITIPTSHSSMVDEYIIMLVNGELYKYFHMAYYRANKFIIPIQEINYDDTIELLRFQNVNNSVMDIVINESDGFINYSDNLINDSMSLFYTEYNGATYTYPEDGLQHFEVEYSLEKNKDGLTKIVLKDPYYYGKTLKLAYKNRFKHHTFKISESSKYDAFTINLGNKFMYCPEYSRYLVFINGRRLLSNHYRLVLPVRPTTPFYEFKIYLTTPMTVGDKLDIIYTPSLIQDVVINNEISTGGDIIVDKTILDYGLSTDLYMIWINGKKVPVSHVTDIDSGHMRITTDEESTNTLCITKYIPSIDVLDEVFDNNIAIWDSIVANMTSQEINKLLGVNIPMLTNTEPDIYDGAADIKQVMHELLRDQFLCNPMVDVSGAFVYDYTDVDTSAISGTDNSSNDILLAADANHDDNVVDVVRETP